MPAYSLGTMGAWAVTSHTDQIITGAKTFQAAAVSVTPLKVKGVASQTANLQEWQNNAGTVLASITSAGGLIVNANTQSMVGTNSGASGAVLTVDSYLAGNKALVIRGSASQTGNLQEWQNSAGTVLSYISSGGAGIFNDARVNGVVLVGDAVGVLGKVSIDTEVPGDRGLVIRGAASQSANLAEFQDSAGAVKSAVSASGAFKAGNSVPGVVGINTDPFGPAAVGLVVRGAASQTANLAEFQDSAGTVKTAITTVGWLNAPIVNIGGASNDGSVNLFTQASDAAKRPLMVRGAASQTANLSEWQDSVGTLLAYVSKGGSMVFSGGAQIYGTADANNSGVSTFIQPITATHRALVVRGISGQTANLAEFQNSSATALSGFDSAGRLMYGSGGDYSSAALGSYAGKIAVNINGTMRWIPYYA